MGKDAAKKVEGKGGRQMKNGTGERQKERHSHEEFCKGERYDRQTRNE